MSLTLPRVCIWLIKVTIPGDDGELRAFTTNKIVGICINRPRVAIFQYLRQVTRPEIFYIVAARTLPLQCSYVRDGARLEVELNRPGTVPDFTIGDHSSSFASESEFRV